MRDVMERIFDQSLKYSVRIDDHTVTRPLLAIRAGKLRAHNFGNLIRMYYTVSNHSPPLVHGSPWPIHPCTRNSALTFRHFRPLVRQSRVTPILLLWAPIDDGGGRDMISHEELKLLIYSRAIDIHNITGTTAMGTF
ncbi:hypothetical protein QTP88_003715 [Uroleucon formosanum]